MEALKLIGLWTLFIIFLIGSVAIYIKAQTVEWQANKIFKNEMKQEEQEINLEWNYRCVKMLSVISAVGYFGSYLVAGRLLALSTLSFFFCIAFFLTLAVADPLYKKLNIYVETGKINSVAYLGYLYSVLSSLGAFDQPMQLVPTYAQLTKENIFHSLSKNEAPEWFAWTITCFALFLTPVLTLVLLSTALLCVCGAQEHAGYLTVRDAIHKWHRKHLNQIMHGDDFEKISASLDAKVANKAKVRKILRVFGATSLSGTYFYLNAVFTKVNVAIGVILTGWGLWFVIPESQQESVERFISDKILKIQFSEWDSWASIVTGTLLVVGIYFAYLRVEQISPIFRIYNYEKAVEKISDLYTGYSNLLDIWIEHYKSNLSRHLNDVYYTYLENISEGHEVITVAGIYKFNTPGFSHRADEISHIDELLKILDSIDKIFEEIHNKAEATVVRKFLLKHNLLFGYLDQYRFIDGYSKFSEQFEIPGNAEKRIGSATENFRNPYFDSVQSMQKVRAETRSFIVRTELDILMTYLRIREVERTVNAISGMHRKSVKEKISGAISGK